MSSAGPDDDLQPLRWEGRDLRFTLEVRHIEGGYRAEAAYADNGEIVAAGEGGKPADALAGAAGALSALMNRVEIAAAFKRSARRLSEAAEVD